MHTKAALEQTTTTARDDRERITRGLPNEIETGHLSADLDAKRDLFCDTAAGAQASAKLFSLVEACKANGVDVYCYLVALPEALPYPRTGVGIRTIEQCADVTHVSKMHFENSTKNAQSHDERLEISAAMSQPNGGVDSTALDGGL